MPRPMIVRTNDGRVFRVVEDLGHAYRAVRQVRIASGFRDATGAREQLIRSACCAPVDLQEAA